MGGPLSHSEATLALRVLEQLDIGIVVCAGSLDRLLLANPAAAQILEGLGGGGGELPPPLKKALSERLAEASPVRFARAVALTAPSGRRLLARVKPLGVPPDVLAVITLKVLRQRDPTEVLMRRFRFTRRQGEMISYVREGLSNEAIANEMKLTVGTVKNYLSSIFAALEVRNRVELLIALQRLESSEMDGEAERDPFGVTE